MLAHFTRNMSQDITLAGQVDAEHCPRQYLGHRPFGHDLRFLRHAVKCLRTSKVQPTQLPAQCCFRKKLAYFAPLPPCTSSSAFFRSSELILEQDCTNVFRGFLGKGIACE